MKKFFAIFGWVCAGSLWGTFLMMEVVSSKATKCAQACEEKHQSMDYYDGLRGQCECVDLRDQWCKDWSSK